MREVSASDNNTLADAKNMAAVPGSAVVVTQGPDGEM